MFKNIKLLMFLTLGILIVSCDQDESITYEEGDYTKIASPYVQVQTPVVSFQAGTPEYTISLNAVNGTKKLSKVELYSTFTDAATEKSSNETMLASFDVTEPVFQEFSKTINYTDLKNGLTIEGSSLPESDLDLAIGSGWSVRIEAVYEDGSSGSIPGSINIAVLHRFAGLYKVIDSEYYRIGVFSTDWNGSTRYIGSVDENTFSYNNYWGNFGWSGKAFNFDVDYENDNAITVPIIVQGLFSGTYAINCDDSSDKFTKVSCEGSNVVVADDVTGKHKIYLTYGYYTASGDANEGAREFYEVLEKVVD